MSQDETYRRVQAQFGCTAAGYVERASHARGADLEQLVALAEALRPGAMAEKTVLDVATGGGHTALAFARAGVAGASADARRGRGGSGSRRAGATGGAEGLLSRQRRGGGPRVPRA